MKVPPYWFKDQRGEEQKQTITRDLVNGRGALERLKHLLQEEHETTIAAMRSLTPYTTMPNWDRWVADHLGYLRCLDKIISHIPDFTLTEGKNHV